MATNPKPFRLTTEDEVTAILGEPPDFVLATISQGPHQQEIS